MRVMVLGLRGIPDVQGGVETHAQHLYSHLADLGCEVEVIVRNQFVPEGRRTFGSVKLRRIWAPRSAGIEAFVHSLLGVIYAGLARPDILHIHAIGPAIVTPIARLLGLTAVVTHHGPDYDRDKWGPFAKLVLRCGESCGMRYSHGRIAISTVIENLIRSKYGRDSEIIPNGVLRAERTEDTDHVLGFGLVPNRYFLQVSRIVPEKRQIDLIRAFKTARPLGWQLALVGEVGRDSYSRKVQVAAAAAGVVLTGFLKGAALRQLYSHAGAFVLPSSHEGLPIAMLEALSYGLPVLASNIPANLAVGLAPSNYFPIGDVAILSTKLLELAELPSSESASDSRARWVTRQFDWEQIARRTLAFYRSVLLARDFRLAPPK